MQVFVTVTAIAVMFIFSLSAHAQSAAEALYKSKCAGCHGADGTGSATGKKMGAHDFYNGRRAGNVGHGTLDCHYERQEQDARLRKAFEARRG